VTRAARVLVATSPLAAAAAVTPDATAPLLDLAPLLRPAPFAGLPASVTLGEAGGADAAPILRPGEALFSLHPAPAAASRAIGHVRAGSTFSVRVLIRSTAAEPLFLTGIRLAPPAAGAAAAGAPFALQTTADALAEQLLGASTVESAPEDATSDPVIRAALALAAGKGRAAAPRARLLPVGGEVRLV
jgi:hypothetical protein